jgi:hypothetical protein
MRISNEIQQTDPGPHPRNYPSLGKEGQGGVMEDFSRWKLSEHKSDLPYSDRVNIPALLGVFGSTSASYKYLFFLSLLDILEASTFDRLGIDFDEILLEMLVNAWYPHVYFKLSFGVNDRITRELDRLNVLQDGANISGNAKKEIRRQIFTRDYTRNNLMDMVPYRLLSPFFSGELQGMTDAKRNRAIINLSYEKFEERRPLYFFMEQQGRKSLVMHPQWMLYFYENLSMLRSFICWSWLDYMQRRNPSVPNVQVKLFPPQSRNSLLFQTKYWKDVMSRDSLSCIYTGEELSLEDLSLDHFLPWSFVAHDQLWNLIPVSKSINSSKNNYLPSLDRYFPRFAALQFQGLESYHRAHGKNKKS